MAFPVFASGDVLRAADMNAVGLWLVKSQSIGSAVSSFTVTSAFSADYDHYLILINTNSSTSSPVQANMTLGSTATGYYRTGIYMSYGSTTVTGVTDNNATSWTDVLRPHQNSTECYAQITLMNPYASRRTAIVSSSPNTSTNTSTPVINVGMLNDTTSYTAFTFTTNTGTLTGGSVRVYGYRN